MVFHSLECSFVDSTVHSALYTGSASDQGSTGQAASQCEEVGGRRVGRGDPVALQNTLAHITHTKANDSSLYADVEV